MAIGDWISRKMRAAHKLAMAHISLTKRIRERAARVTSREDRAAKGAEAAVDSVTSIEASCRYTSARQTAP